MLALVLLFLCSSAVGIPRLHRCASWSSLPFVGISLCLRDSASGVLCARCVCLVHTREVAIGVGHWLTHHLLVSGIGASVALALFRCCACLSGMQLGAFVVCVVLFFTRFSGPLNKL